MAGGRAVYHMMLILAAAVLAVLAAPSAKGDDDRICGMTRAELMECKPPVAAGVDVPPPPTKNCCAYLGHANLPCFCQLKKDKPYYFALLAIKLPTVCDSTKIAPCAP